MEQPWYQNAITYPKAFGVFSFSLIFNLIVAMYVLSGYTRGIILRSLKNYCQLRITNVETLLALGCIGAFAMFVFLLAKSTIDEASDELVQEA